MINALMPMPILSAGKATNNLNMIGGATSENFGTSSASHTTTITNLMTQLGGATATPNRFCIVYIPAATSGTVRDITSLSVCGVQIYIALNLNLIHGTGKTDVDNIYLFPLTSGLTTNTIVVGYSGSRPVNSSNVIALCGIASFPNPMGSENYLKGVGTIGGAGSSVLPTDLTGPNSISVALVKGRNVNYSITGPVPNRYAYLMRYKSFFDEPNNETIDYLCPDGIILYDASDARGSLTITRTIANSYMNSIGTTPLLNITYFGL